MSKEALAKVVQRAISDAGFRRQLNSDPAGALRGFDLSADETSAIRTGDAGRLQSLGVDQRMSKAFGLGGALASTRMAMSDLTPAGPSLVDDLSGAGGRTVTPADPQIDAGADTGGAGAGGNAVRVGDDYKFAGRVAPDTNQTVRTGDDWKFADRAAQGSAAPVEGSPEATAADMKAAGGMAAYPEHNGLAGPSGAASVRAGDDWARANATSADTAARAGNARLDDASGADGASRLAKLDASFSGGTANADATASGTDGSARLAKLDEMFSGGTAAADTSSETPTTAYVADSEEYITKVGYDVAQTPSQVTDAHERGVWSGDDIAGPATTPDANGDSVADPSDAGPQITS